MGRQRLTLAVEPAKHRAVGLAEETGETTGEQPQEPAPPRPLIHLQLSMRDVPYRRLGSALQDQFVDLAD